jgi:pyrimidine operon attenuation protein/uracil phosphoribosyltransferase
MSALNGQVCIYDSDEMAEAVAKIAFEITEMYSPEETAELAIIGIQKSGVPFSRRLADAIFTKSGKSPLLGALDISMYRDDIGMRKSLPVILPTEIPFDINGRVIILADDVLHTGRTIRAALDAITDYGRPAFIRLAALIDRGGHEFPIRADHTGINASSFDGGRLRVRWRENDGEDAVYERNEAPSENAGAMTKAGL